MQAAPQIGKKEGDTLREKGGDGSFQGVGIEMIWNHQESGGQCQAVSQEGETILGTLEEAGISRGPLRKR